MPDLCGEREAVRNAGRRYVDVSDASWSPFKDREVLEGLMGGRKCPDIAPTVEHTPDEVRLRLRKLIPEPTPETQQAMLRVLRLMTGDAA